MLRILLHARSSRLQVALAPIGTKVEDQTIRQYHVPTRRCSVSSVHTCTQGFGMIFRVSFQSESRDLAFCWGRWCSSATPPVFNPSKSSALRHQRNFMCWWVYTLWAPRRLQLDELIPMHVPATEAHTLELGWRGSSGRLRAPAIEADVSSPKGTAPGSLNGLLAL